MTAHPTSRPIVPSLLERISPHSPEIVALAKWYFRETGQPLENRKHFDKTDASAKLALAVFESMIHLEQLRMELTDELATRSASASHSIAIGEIIRMEALLISSCKLSIDIHGAIWETDLFDTATIRDKSERLI